MWKACLCYIEICIMILINEWWQNCRTIFLNKCVFHFLYLTYQIPRLTKMSVSKRALLRSNIHTVSGIGSRWDVLAARWDGIVVCVCGWMGACVCVCVCVCVWGGGGGGGGGGGSGVTSGYSTVHTYTISFWIYSRKHIFSFLIIYDSRDDASILNP